MSKSKLVTQYWVLDSIRIPKGWKLVALQDFAEIKSGFASGQHNNDGIGVIHLRPMNITPAGELNLSDGRFIDPSENPLRLHRGDILFNNTNSPLWVGKTAYIDIEMELAFSNHMTRIRVFEGIQPKLIVAQFHLLQRSGYFFHQCKKYVNQASINQSKLGKTTPFLLPPKEEQIRITSMIELLQERSSNAQKLLVEINLCTRQNL